MWHSDLVWNYRASSSDEDAPPGGAKQIRHESALRRCNKVTAVAFRA